MARNATSHDHTGDETAAAAAEQKSSNKKKNKRERERRSGGVVDDEPVAVWLSESATRTHRFGRRLWIYTTRRQRRRRAPVRTACVAKGGGDACMRVRACAAPRTTATARPTTNELKRRRRRGERVLSVGTCTAWRDGRVGGSGPRRRRLR